MWTSKNVTGACEFGIGVAALFIGLPAIITANEVARDGVPQLPRRAI
jgi:hypothetical protein